jgi:hypothetical protein
VCSGPLGFVREADAHVIGNGEKRTQDEGDGGVVRNLHGMPSFYMMRLNDAYTRPLLFPLLQQLGLQNVGRALVDLRLVRHAHTSLGAEGFLNY